MLSLTKSLIKSFVILSVGSAFLLANPIEQPCPKEVSDLPDGTTCWSGQDSEGAYYWIAKPKDWNKNLVMHAHGGPALGKATFKRATDDFKRWSIWVRDGYALAITSYRQGGVEVMAAAEDVARLLPIAVSVVGKPDKTILHGQSWGGGVAARAAEENGPFSKVKPKLDGVLLTSGVLAGGILSYDFRLDLRAVWQVVCANHPRANETQYPLWQGLPAKDAKMSRDDLSARVNECLGLDKDKSNRTKDQLQNIQTIVNVIKIPESSIQSHLTWATNHFQDIVFNRLDGKNPFGNEKVVYVDSNDDKELNKKVLRYKPDPIAFEKFKNDADPTGDINLPILTIRGIDDPTAFVELASTWQDTVKKAGKEQNLVQLYTNDAGHSYLSDAQYVATMNALLEWIDNAKKPTPTSVANDCKKLDKKWDPQNECRILPEYEPKPLSSRVPAR
ncbi:MAG: alpha/beta hydrolase family protein [Campylobacteraceae bacterium]